MNRPTLRSPWRSALALPALQAAAGAVAAMAATIAFGARDGLGVAAGACAVAAGFLVFGWRTALRPQAVGAGTSFMRLLVGLLFKWLVVVAVLLVALRSGSVGATGVLSGVLLAYLAYFLSLPWLLR